MFKVSLVLAVFCAFVHTAPPHHQFADSSDKDVKQFGELLEQIAVLFEKGKRRKIILK